MSDTYDENSIRDIAALYDAQDITTLFQNTAGTTPVTTDGQAVKAWVSKGSVTATATEATNNPTYAASGINGHPALSWTGTQLLTASTTLFDSTWDKAFTLFSVCQPTAYSDNRVVFSDGPGNAYLENNAGGGTPGPKFSLTGTSAFNKGFYAGPQLDLMRYDGRTMTVYSVRGRGTTQWRRDLTGGVNPKLNDPRTATLGATGGLVIGAYGGGGFNFSGKIGLVGCVHRCIDDYELRDLLEYESAKWGLANSPFVICIGDSLTDGSGTTANSNGTMWPELLQVDYGSTAIVERSAYAGRYLNQFFQENSADVLYRSWPNACAGQQVATLLLGSNDLLSYPLASVQASYALAVSRLTRMGFAVVVVTVPYRTQHSDATLRGYVDTFNVWLRSYAAIGAVGCADLAADSRLGTVNCWNNTTYYQGDAIHQTPAGEVIKKGIIKPAVDAAMTLAARVGADLSFNVPLTSDVRNNTAYGKGLTGTCVINRTVTVREVTITDY